MLGDASPRGCDWCGYPLAKRQKRCCSRACTVRCQNRDRARAARWLKALDRS
jgi:predicted nucleic acid-binding Zn ribbon protein